VTTSRKPDRQTFRISGKVYLWIAIIIFGASNAITQKLTRIGSQNFVGGENPISFCNVLFVGNLCALIVMISIYWRQWNLNTVKQISHKEWMNLTLVAILSGALAPALIFQALALTSVNNVILVGRLEPPLTLALSVWLLGETVNLWQVMGAITALIGVSLSIFLYTPQENMMSLAGVTVGVGEVLAAIGAIALAISTIISKGRVSNVPLAIFSVYRTALGTAIFFILALIFYGSDHFMNAFSPFLWKWMLLYGTIIVVVGQSFWNRGLRASQVSTISLASSFTPIAGIVAAYLILGETPTIAQYIGGSVILVGIILSQIGIKRQTSARAAMNRVDSAEAQQEVETGIGFKGI
jgi:drug/metabolite transporter (DMT)-like permease